MPSDLEPVGKGTVMLDVRAEEGTLASVNRNDSLSEFVDKPARMSVYLR
jgi:hypothetical protein